MKKNNKGFSLVELIVVIAIMAILAAVAVFAFSAYIQKARNASDAEYISNVVYFAELFATENQVGVDGIHLPKDKVDSVDDIKLWVIDPDSGEKVLKDHNDLPWIKDIYDGVGNWEFIGDLEYDFDAEGGEGGNTPGDSGNQGGSSGGNEGSQGGEGSNTCSHPQTSVEDRITVNPTCKVKGRKVQHCNDCNTDIAGTESDIPTVPHEYEKLNVNIEGFTISQCKWCKEKLIKNQNNLPLIPMG